MNNYSKPKAISDRQMADYIFDDLDAEESRLVESYLMENEKAYSTSLELMLMVLEKKLSKVDLLAFLRKTETFSPSLF